MLERFAAGAQRALLLAEEESVKLNHDHIGTEHILLGLIREGQGIAANALNLVGIRLEAVREQVELIADAQQHDPRERIQYSLRAKKVLELTFRESLQLGHNYIGTEHILLALIRERDGAAAEIMGRLGADLNTVRQQVIQLLLGYHQAKDASSTG